MQKKSNYNTNTDLHYYNNENSTKWTNSKYKID